MRIVGSGKAFLVADVRQRLVFFLDSVPVAGWQDMMGVAITGSSEGKVKALLEAEVFKPSI